MSQHQLSRLSVYLCRDGEDGPWITNAEFAFADEAAPAGSPLAATRTGRISFETDLSQTLTLALNQIENACRAEIGLPPVNP